MNKQKYLARYNKTYAGRTTSAFLTILADTHADALKIAREYEADYKKRISKGAYLSNLYLEVEI